MPKLSDIRTIVEEPNLGITVLRSFPKETLIEAILELKRTSADHYIKMREAEQQERILQLNYQLNDTQVRKELTEKLFALSENFAQHKYGPNAIGNIGAGLASIWGKPSTATTQTPELGEEFVERIEKAKSQGMRWNKADKQPERQSTIVKKLEAWEAGISRGLAADPALYLDRKYEEILKTEGGEAFMVGLCEKIESKYGIGPMSKYLKTRHKRCIEKLGRGANPVESEPVVPTLTNTDHAIELIKRAWGDSLDDFNYNDIKKHLIRRLDSAGGVDKIELKPFRGLCDAKSLPTFFEYTEKPEHPLDKLKDIKAGKYDEHFIKLLDGYRAEVAGK